MAFHDIYDCYVFSVIREEREFGEEGRASFRENSSSVRDHVSRMKP